MRLPMLAGLLVAWGLAPVAAPGTTSLAVRTGPTAAMATQGSRPSDLHSSMRPYGPRFLSSSGPRAGRLSARYMGISTILLDDGDTSLMVDGFFSRPNGWHLAAGTGPNSTRIKAALARAQVTTLTAVLATHSHHDHGMDSGAVAIETGAFLIGSPSSANIGLGSGLPADRIRLVEGGETCTIGRFRITFIPSPHGRPLFFPGRIRTPLRPPVDVAAYREGGNLSFLIEHDGWAILVHGTPGFRTGLMRDVAADIIFLSIPTVGEAERRIADYWREIVVATRPQLVIPIHWDNFMRSLDEPLAPMGRFRRAMDAVDRLAADPDVPVTVRFMPTFEPVDLIAATPTQRPRTRGLPADGPPAGSCASTLPRPAAPGRRPRAASR